MVIAHATDLSGDDSAAFVHAGALAMASGARLVTLHGNAPATDVARLPDVGELAKKWGRAIAHERRCHEYADDVADTVIDALRELRPELVILGTHGRHGLSALVHESVSATIARNVAVPTLVVPNHARGFVDPDTGKIDLHRIVIPAGTPADEQRGRDAARRLATLAGVGATLEVLTVTTGSIAPAHHEAARDASLIVMATAGHDGIGDVVFGSHTERVISHAACPVLSVPV